MPNYKKSLRQTKPYRTRPFDSEELEKHIRYNERTYGSSETQDYKDLASAYKREAQEREAQRLARQSYERYKDYY